jgi:integrase
MRHGAVVPLLGWRPAQAGEHAPKGLPLGELWASVERYVWDRPGVAGKTAANRRRTRELAKTLPDHPTPVDVMAWLTTLDGMFAPGTVENHRKGLAAVYRYGADLGLCSGNPAALVPRRRADPRPHPIVNIAEVWPRLVAACKDGREAAFLGVLRFAGLRRGEALGLEVRDVLTHGAAWRLNVVRQRPDPNRLEHTKPKTSGSCRELPVRGPLRELLAPVVAAGNPTVRVGMGGGDSREVPFLFPYREQDLDDLIGRLRQAAPLAFPVGHKAWHALRDTLSVEMRQAGKTTSEVAEVLGHSSEYVTRTHYLGMHGASVHGSTLEGLDGPAPPARGGAPPGRGAVVEGGTAGVRAPTAPRRSTAVNPERESPCNATTKRSGTGRAQRSLPGLSVGPVAVKPKRGRR